MAETAPSTLGDLCLHVREALAEAGIDDAALDARLIVEHVTATSRLDAVLEPDRYVDPAKVAEALAFLDRRLAGEPVHRILGFRDFYGMALTLSKDTLEPRPDTETLVDLALPFARAAADRHGVCTILDLGTGTGAVALALLREEPRATATGTDISEDALATAARNADMTGNAARFATLRSNWFDAVRGRFHIIVSNPPYIVSKVIATLQREVRDHDPIAALDGGSDGLDAYRAIAAHAADHLTADGVVAVEIGFDQAGQVTALFEAAGLRHLKTARDLGRHDRALAFARQES